ncbi:hypothetical protein SAM40697_6799 [Streptomyces ambofaciens]|uniref:Uncharacterized protein n=1 Tax=Streptomyces ambofaciens TaxID=1889 RepID=A0ABN4P155_STRAM|nr:hypothetical protein SAM40697_0126 [Streptomyces ambofaciens]ANB10751.1 hypothetical protein SAM40697_6799 [Streptomyces ambofaciens]
MTKDQEVPEATVWSGQLSITLRTSTDRLILFVQPVRPPTPTILPVELTVGTLANQLQPAD